MRKSIILALYCLPFYSIAQFPSDSLWTVWTNEQEADSNRVKALQAYYTEEFIGVDFDSALVYARIHQAFGAQMGSKKYMASGQNNIGRCQLALGKLDSAMLSFQEAARLYMEAGLPGSAAGSTINSGIVLANWGRTDEAIAAYAKGIEQAEQAGEIQFKLNALNNTGVIHLDRGEYDQAIPVFEELISVADSSFPGSEAHMGGYVNLGYTLAKRGDHARAIDNFNACIKLMENHGRSPVAVYLYNFLGSSYLTLNEIDNATHYFEKSIAIADSIGDLVGKSSPLANLASIKLKQGDHLGARRLFEEAYDLKVQNGQIGSALQELAHLASMDLEEGKLDSAEAKASRNLQRAKDIKDINGQSSALTILGKTYNRKGRYRAALDALNQARTIALEIGEPELIMGAVEEMSEVHEKLGEYAEALKSKDEFILYRDSIERNENKRAAIRQEFRYSYEKRALADSLEFAQKEAIKDLEIEKKDADIAKQRIALAATGGGLLLLFLLAYSIRMGKRRSDELLHNILPEEVALELKKKGKVGSKRIESVTVLFTDFKGFTAMSEQLSPKELVNDLNQCFSAFDEITSKFEIEKIKTIGDAYMAAGGVPIPNQTHASDVIHAAIEMRDFVEAGKQRKIVAGLPYFEIRIGIHTGPVVAGIVGVKKFQYDIWGDTVNTASRMESSGEVGKVNISSTTYALLKDDPEFTFTSRGKIEAKGKGGIEMYFVSTT